VKRQTASFSVHNTDLIKQQMLHWVDRFNICCFLDNHHYDSVYSSVECLAGAGAVKSFRADENIFPQLSRFYQQENDWLFGHIGYDLKNEVEQLHSDHPDHIGFPTVYFFQPEVVLQLQDGQLRIASVNTDPQIIFQELSQIEIPTDNPGQHIITQPRISRKEYIDTIGNLLQHIHRGDCYEINFCQEFFARDVVLNTVQAYTELTRISPNPFCCFYKLDQRYLLCASPERFLQKKGTRLLSQPIKGTLKRDPATDEAAKQQLQQSPKDRSENVMVVDLVRNDLSRICKEGSVKVEELFGVYSFPQVHQMISTITGELKEGLGLPEILKAVFPMGSMTGAPKKRVMELIEQYESSKRGIYSGAVGYISPEKDFDFNVVIRSILYNATAKYLSYQVGGGITAYSDPEKEYEECLLKAAAIQKVLQPVEAPKNSHRFAD
jgi:para-aminobenzoate synthetase component 1